MTPTTRQQLLATARTLFADRGFYGVSIANIADEHGLSKQALLHYFPTKEKLYGEILKEIASELEQMKSDAMSSGADPAEQLKRLLSGMIPAHPADTERARILMRELLDNKHRAETVGAWYLKPFLEDITNLAKTIPAWSNLSDTQTLAVIYQLLGAANYFSVSEPTLRGIFGKRNYVALTRVFATQFDALIDAVTSGSPLQKEKTIYP
ncbi:MAG: TetR/AcrR family transcriptional regulator [Pseudomonadota bacterium]